MGNTRNTGYLQNAVKVADNGDISLMHGSTMLMQISASGAITTTGVISGSNALSASFAATASTAVSAVTASFVALAQSASNAVSAQTASFANTLTVAGTLTAQTLVVQTITSSVDFVTGSTRFGSILDNTHVFSGSVSMNPGGLFVSSSGNVGIGTLGTAYSGYTTLAINNSTYGGLIDLQYGGTSGMRISSENTVNTFWGATNIPMRFATNATERIRITADGYLQLNGTSNSAIILTDSSANVIGLFATSSVIDNTPRIEVTGTTFAGTPSTAFIRANTVRFTLNNASTETMRIASDGRVGIGTTSPSEPLSVSFAAHGLISQHRQSSGVGVGQNFYMKFNTANGTAAGYAGIYADIQSNTDGAHSGRMILQVANAGSLLSAVTINPSGNVIKSYQALAMGAMAGDQSVSATTFTSIAFNTSYGFNQANVGSCWNNGSSTFTAPATGTYLINASLYTTNVGQIAAFINGSRNISMVSGFAVTGGITWHGTIMIKMNSGDALTLRGYGDSGGTIYQNTYHTWFGIYFLG